MKNGMNFSKEAIGIGFPFVNLLNIFGRNQIDIGNLGKAMASPGQLRDYNLVAGDVLFVRSSVKLEGVGEAALVPETLENTTYSGFIIRFRDETGLNNSFKRFVFSTEDVRRQIMSQATDSANKNISQTVLSNLEFYLPGRDEQEAVGTFFANLDALITLHQRKYDKLVAIKRSMLEKMFPREGSRFPEIRFAGFTDPWEQRKFNDVFSILQNCTLSRAELSYDNGEAFNIHYGDVLIKFGEVIDAETAILPRITDDKIVASFRSSALQDGDIVIADTAEDEAVGKCAEMLNLQEKTAISGLHTIPVRPTARFATGYLGYFMNSPAFHDQLLPLMQGTKVTSVSKSALQDTVISFPSERAEQGQIGRYFMALDTLITLHQRKLEKLQAIKRSMLEKMFV